MPNAAETATKPYTLPGSWSSVVSRPNGKTSLPELLAPAGGPAALRAAVANGADAVYLGLDRLNARRGAENFTLDTLADACRLAHLRDVRVYLTANVLIRDDEMADALRLIDEAWGLGVDAVIVQDLGLLREVRTRLPHVRVHASTQINAHNSATVVELAGLGVSRVTLARETSVDEIATLAHAADVEVESFVHGALCMCYSGQCLLSSLIGARSANRGMCAQPCRLPYELADEAGRTLDTPGSHLLSPKDLAGISMLPELAGTGAAALKIEGRMKSPEYVALVTGVYRAALDRAGSSDSGFEVRDAERRVLDEAFSRGFTSAYLEGRSDNSMMSYQRPNNRGVPVGRVSEASGSLATLALDVALESDDTIQFWTSSGRFGQRVGPLRYGGSEHAAAPAGMRVQLTTEEPVRAGDRVFRVANASLLAAARRTFDEHSAQATPLAFSVRVVAGEPLAVDVVDESGRRGRAEGTTVEQARTKAVTAEEVIEHVGRLGGTRYEASSWSVDLSPDVGVGFSELHRVRRDALEDYERAVLEPWARRDRVMPTSTQASSPAITARPVGAKRQKRRDVALAVSVESADLAAALLDAGAEIVQVPSYGLIDLPRIDPRIAAVLPRIAHDREMEDIHEVARRSERVVAGNLGLLAFARESGLRAEAHWGLNALNSSAVASLADLGARLVWLSPELSGGQLARLGLAAEVPVGIAIYGRQEVMVTEHCILAAEGECSQRCGSCGRRRGFRFLKDRKGYRFPVRTDPTGRSHVYNAIPLDLAGSLADVLDAGVSAVRLDFVTETTEECVRITRQVRQALDSTLAGFSVGQPLVQPSTTGHFFRGVK